MNALSKYPAWALTGASRYTLPSGQCEQASLMGQGQRALTAGSGAQRSRDKSRGGQSQRREGGRGPQRPWRVPPRWMTQAAARDQGELLGSGGAAGFLEEEMEADGNV